MSLLIKERIVALDTELKALEAELASLKGRLAGRKESIAKGLRDELAAGRQRMDLLTEIAHSLSQDALRPRTPAEAQLQLERLKKEIINHCTKFNVDQELWKNLAS